MSDESLLLEQPAAPDGSPKRRQVLDAARELFLARGYGAVSMDAVAQRAGVSKATLYAHFASKDDLFATMMGECSLADTVEEHLFPQPATDLRAALEAIGQAALRFVMREQTLAVLRIAIAESARFPELGRAFFARGPQRTQERLREWLAYQQSAGLVRRDADLEAAAEQFGALLRGGLLLRAALALPPPPTEADIDRTVAAAVATWLRAFAA
jgi:TetR/AcrR family transcriptional repressor of mexJK operon